MEPDGSIQHVEEFRLGGVGEGLEVIAGPYTSSQSSYQMINGSLITKKQSKEEIDNMFQCYEAMVEVPVKESLED